MTETTPPSLSDRLRARGRELNERPASARGRLGITLPSLELGRHLQAAGQDVSRLVRAAAGELAKLREIPHLAEPAYHTVTENVLGRLSRVDMPMIGGKAIGYAGTGLKFGGKILANQTAESLVAGMGASLYTKAVLRGALAASGVGLVGAAAVGGGAGAATGVAREIIKIIHENRMTDTEKEALKTRREALKTRWKGTGGIIAYYYSWNKEGTSAGAIAARVAIAAVRGGATGAIGGVIGLEIGELFDLGHQGAEATITAGARQAAGQIPGSGVSSGELLDQAQQAASAGKSTAQTGIAQAAAANPWEVAGTDQSFTAAAGAGKSAAGQTAPGLVDTGGPTAPWQEVTGTNQPFTAAAGEFAGKGELLDQAQQAAAASPWEVAGADQPFTAAAGAGKSAARQTAPGLADTGGPTAPWQEVTGTANAGKSAAGEFTGKIDDMQKVLEGGITITKDSTPWSSLAEAFKTTAGRPPSAGELMELTRAMCQDNNIAVAEWGIQGAISDRNIPTGTVLKLGKETTKILARFKSGN